MNAINSLATTETLPVMDVYSPIDSVESILNQAISEGAEKVDFFFNGDMFVMETETSNFQFMDFAGLPVEAIEGAISDLVYGYSLPVSFNDEVVFREDAPETLYENGYTRFEIEGGNLYVNIDTAISTLQMGVRAYKDGMLMCKSKVGSALGAVVFHTSLEYDIDIIETIVDAIASNCVRDALISQANQAEARNELDMFFVSQWRALCRFAPQFVNAFNIVPVKLFSTLKEAPTFSNLHAPRFDRVDSDAHCLTLDELSTMMIFDPTDLVRNQGWSHAKSAWVHQTRSLILRNPFDVPVGHWLRELVQPSDVSPTFSLIGPSEPSAPALFDDKPVEFIECKDVQVTMCGRTVSLFNPLVIGRDKETGSTQVAVKN